MATIAELFRGALKGKIFRCSCGREDPFLFTGDFDPNGFRAYRLGHNGGFEDVPFDYLSCFDGHWKEIGPRELDHNGARHLYESEELFRLIGHPVNDPSPLQA